MSSSFEKQWKPHSPNQAQFYHLLSLVHKHHFHHPLYYFHSFDLTSKDLNTFYSETFLDEDSLFKIVLDVVYWCVTKHIL